MDAALCWRPPPSTHQQHTTRHATQGVVDLVKMKAIVWDGEELGATFDEVDIPADLQELANEYREKLIDAVVELDDAVRQWRRSRRLVIGFVLGVARTRAPSSMARPP
jgi:hypothetical protein